ncbi:hypothetical protein GGR58DRAFT_26089 [Xylaria digitata]|nr:hypothetical protein GGR58DRAFT_26089 [Xylaria digitata]
MDRFYIAPRYSLCRFEFAGNENITMVRPDGRSIALPFGKLEDGTCTYEPCYPGYYHRDKRLTSYYVSCTWHGDYQLVPRLFDAISYAYDPGPDEDARRLRWIHNRTMPSSYHGRTSLYRRFM